MVFLKGTSVERDHKFDLDEACLHGEPLFNNKVYPSQVFRGGKLCKAKGAYLYPDHLLDSQENGQGGVFFVVRFQAANRCRDRH